MQKADVLKRIIEYSEEFHKTEDDNIAEWIEFDTIDEIFQYCYKRGY